MNNHSFLPSFIPLFLPSSSRPLQVLFIPPISLESFKIKVNHFLYVDKVNSPVFDCPVHLLETCSFLDFNIPFLPVFSCIFTVFSQSTSLSTQSLLVTRHLNSSTQGLAVTVFSVYTHSLDDLNFFYSLNTICYWLEILSNLVLSLWAWVLRMHKAT